MILHFFLAAPPRASPDMAAPLERIGGIRCGKPCFARHAFSTPYGINRGKRKCRRAPPFTIRSLRRFGRDSRETALIHASKRAVSGWVRQPFPTPPTKEIFGRPGMSIFCSIPANRFYDLQLNRVCGMQKNNAKKQPAAEPFHAPARVGCLFFVWSPAAFAALIPAPAARPNRANRPDYKIQFPACRLCRCPPHARAAPIGR